MDHRNLYCLLISVFFSSLLSAEGMETQEVFVSGRGGYHTYRIPAILRTSRGSLLAFCEGRRESRQDTGNIDLLLKRSTDNGRNWSEPILIWDDGANTCGNPCVVVNRATGEIILLASWNLGSDQEKEIIAGTSRDTRRVYLLSSLDDGITWSPPREITGQVKRQDWRWYATGPGIGIQLAGGEKKGRLVIPANHSFPEYYPAQTLGAHVIYSDDGGKNWTFSQEIQPGCNESQVVELSNGDLMMNMRNYYHKGSRAKAISRDGGETWPDRFYETPLMEPVCQASIISNRPQDPSAKTILLFSNPASRTERINMTIRASFDDGLTWPLAKTLYPGPSAYSCLVITAGDRIGCLYEAGENHAYEKILFIRFSPNWLEDPAEK